jgi:hypothetical protein
MEHSAERGRKRKIDDDGEQVGVPSSNATSALARTLGANALMLVGDGEGFRVLHRP